MAEYDRILLVAPAWTGDAVMAHSLLQIIRQAWPTAALDLLAPEPLVPLYLLMPESREVIAAATPHGALALKERRRLGGELGVRNYDLAVIVSRSFKAALAPWFAGIPERRGFRGELRFGLINRAMPEPPRRTPTLQRFARLVPEWSGPTPHPSFRPDEATIADTSRKFGIEPAARPLVLCPGAAGDASKRWPAESYAAVAAHAHDAGREVWILGTVMDRPAAATIRAVAPAARDFTGRTSLADAAALLTFADQVVANDSGLMHLAAAVGVPVLGLYGPTDPEVNPPAGEAGRVLRAPGDGGKAGGRMRHIEPAHVIAALERT